MKDRHSTVVTSDLLTGAHEGGEPVGTRTGQRAAGDSPWPSPGWERRAPPTRAPGGHQSAVLRALLDGSLTAVGGGSEEGGGGGGRH